MNLCRADIKIEARPDDRFAFAPAGVGHLAGRRAPLLQLDILLGDLAEGPVEDRNIMLEAEAQIRVMVVGAVARRRDVGGLQRERLVTIALGDLDAAIPVAMPDVGAPEDHEARFEFFLVREKRHGGLPLCRNWCSLFCLRL